MAQQRLARAEREWHRNDANRKGIEWKSHAKARQGWHGNGMAAIGTGSAYKRMETQRRSKGSIAEDWRRHSKDVISVGSA